MKVLNLVKRFLPDRFFLSWPLYEKAGCHREYWEFMRDNRKDRLSLDEFIEERQQEVIQESVYFNLVTLLRDKFRISTFDTDDHFELILRSVHQALYALNDGSYTPTHSEICDAVMNIEPFIERYEQANYTALDLARLHMISSMSSAKRELMASMPSLAHPVRFVKLRSGAFRIESI